VTTTRTSRTTRATGTSPGDRLPPRPGSTAARSRRNRRLLLLALLAPAGAYLALESFSAPAPVPTGGTRSSSRADGAGPPGAVTAYLSATGIFSRPPPDRLPASFAAAEAAAAGAGSPLAFSVWSDTPSFDAQAWRDQIQVGRVPPIPPPAVDFGREVAVLVWPAADAPVALRQAPGLLLRGARLQHLEVEILVSPAGEGMARATPAGGGEVLPYALVTVPRRQWPIPAPPPSVPPLSVTLDA
jgi:hypothetical protein